MGEIRYGHVEGPGKGREYRVSSNIYFHRKGGRFVRLVNGVATLCASGNAVILGWAETPKDDAGKAGWKSSTSKGADSVFVIYGIDDVYELQCNEKNASLKNLNATFLMKGAAIVTVNDAGTTISTATYQTRQQAKIGGSITASPLTIVDYDVVNHTVRVKIKPTKKIG